MTMLNRGLQEVFISQIQAAYLQTMWKYLIFQEKFSIQYTVFSYGFEPLYMCDLNAPYFMIVG